MKKFFYRVKDGDTVLSLSQRFSLPPLKLIALNNLKKEIEQGDLLIIEYPKGRVYTVSLTDTVNSISEKFNVSPKKILTDNGVPYVFYGLKIFV